MATIKNHLPQVPFSREWLPHLREVALVVGAYFVYMYSRALVFGDFQGILSRYSSGQRLAGHRI